MFGGGRDSVTFKKKTPIPVIVDCKGCRKELDCKGRNAEYCEDCLAELVDCEHCDC